VLLAYVLLLEWTRALAATIPGAVVPALLLGGAGLVLAAWGWPAERLGLGTSRLGLRLVGGIALAAVLLLPAAARVSAVPNLPGALASGRSSARPRHASLNVVFAHALCRTDSRSAASIAAILAHDARRRVRR